MRTFLRSCALVAVALLMAAGNAWGQNHVVGKPAAFGYDSYYADEDDVSSPSDVVAESHGSVAAYSCGVGNGCDTGNGNGCGCDVGNGNGCESACGCGSCSDCCGWCNLGDAWTLQQCENCWGINYGGWFQLGYNSNNVPLSINNADLLSFGDNPDKLNLNQGWFYMEKEAEGECGCWDWGFRFDIMYGTDAQKTQAFGQPTGWDTAWDHGIYGWAIPQAYVSVDNGPLNIIAGHFYTLIGYEVVTAPDNFFFTHSLTMFNSEPFTHTGILASYDVGNGVTAYGGWTAGWDTGFDNFRGGSNFLGGISVPLLENLSLTYITTIGNMGFRGEGYSHSLVFDWEINDRWEYVLQSDLVALEADAFNAGVANDQVGVNQYLFYTVNDCVKLGGRLEWWQTDANQDRYEFTFGVNIRPHANLIFRPEVRYDWGDQVLVPTAPNGEITTFNVDAIFTF